jgi:hypothetical protein
MTEKILVIFDIPGMTAAQYDEIIAELHIAGADHPAGRLSHAAAAKPDGWVIVGIWASQDALGQFGQTLRPILQKVGVTLPPPQVYPVHNFIAD